MAKTFRLASVAQAALAISAAALSAQAFAATTIPDDSGTIAFEGAVSSTTCSISIGGTALPTSSSSVTIKLDTVKTTDFDKDNLKKGTKEFSISFSSCKDIASSLETKFTPDATKLLDSDLKNSAATDAASNVVLRLDVRDPAGSTWEQLLLDKSTAALQSPAGYTATSVKNGAGTQYYRVSYFAVANFTATPPESVGAGAITASLPFTVSYK